MLAANDLYSRSGGLTLGFAAALRKAVSHHIQYESRSNKHSSIWWRRRVQVFRTASSAAVHAHHLPPSFVCSLHLLRWLASAGNQHGSCTPSGWMLVRLEWHYSVISCHRFDAWTNAKTHS
jgi:hypothetical protein